MGVILLNSTIEGGVTPICNSCGVALCWDISDIEYEEQKNFWDAWQCKDCNPDYRGALKRWKLGSVEGGESDKRNSYTK